MRARRSLSSVFTGLLLSGAWACNAIVGTSDISYVEDGGAATDGRSAVARERTVPPDEEPQMSGGTGGATSGAIGPPFNSSGFSSSGTSSGTSGASGTSGVISVSDGGTGGTSGGLSSSSGDF